jgi:hypothetical protein
MIRIVQLPAVPVSFSTGSPLWAQDTTSFTFHKTSIADSVRQAPSPGAGTVAIDQQQ